MQEMYLITYSVGVLVVLGLLYLVAGRVKLPNKYEENDPVAELELGALEYFKE